MKEKTSGKSTFLTMGKWFYAFLAAAVLLVGAIIAIVIISLNSRDVAEQPPAPVVGDETGVYYYDAALGEYTLALSTGNIFTIAGPDLNKSGDYTVNGNTVTLDFVRDEDGTAQATLDGDTLTLVYKDATMNFLKKVPYTVTFNTNGGSAVDAVTVINGKTVVKPNDPAKDGNVFLGWYSDAELTKAFFFGTTPVFGDVTVYAKWAPTVAGQDEYVIDFDLCYDATAPVAISTVGGKLVFNSDYTVPTREGYTFVGWFISEYEDGSKLTYAATENTEINANTTLFAVWSDNDATKLQTPAVSVVGNTISWAAVNGATSYAVTISDSEGNVLFDSSVGTTTQSYDFASEKPGDYQITVVAKGTSAADSDAAVRYYRNKGLDRVSKFEVIGTTLVFNAVENAEKYLITIDCGNDQHNHTLFDNSKSTYYNFANCSMQAGGIAFTVTAVAEGYASTTSETFYYERNLDQVGSIAYDAATATFKWASVANAAKYYVTITCGAHTHEVVDNGTATSFCVKNCTGEISISVVPASFGFNSPEGTTAKVTKVTPATPTNITVNDMTLTWDAVEGAKSYVVKVNGTSYNVTTNSYNLNNTGITFTTGSKHTVTVAAVGETDTSLASDALELTYLTMGKVSYYNNTLSWAPVMGATKFEIRINGTDNFTVENTTSATITLSKSGVNKIEVRPSGFASNTEWTAVEVVAYTVIYETRSPNGSKTEYVATGDKMLLPTDYTYEGFDFAGWYNTPGAAEGNGSEYAETVFVGAGSLTLYANWAPKSYSIKFNGIDSTMSGAANNDTVTVTYTKNYKLPVLTTTDTVNSNFAGWYTGPDGSGTKLTDYLGNSVMPYGYTDNSEAYPYFTSGIIFEMKSDGTYAVKKGSKINDIPVVTIPATYNGIAVTTILENGFYNCDKLVEVNIPDTIKLIGTGAFNSCDAMVSFNVYEVKTETPHEVFYSSHDGALIYEDVASGYTYLEVFPRAKKGAYTVPETVDAVRNRAFNYCNISSLTISKEVKILGDYAFSNCRSLRQIVFEEGSTTPIAISTNAFYGCYSVTSIKLPAHIKGLDAEEAFDVETLNYLTALQTIEVEKAPTAYYSAVEGMLCSALGDTILYCPQAYTGLGGVLTIPKGITAIGEGTFRNRNVFTSIVIPNYVVEIGPSAFYGCRNVTTITIEGDRARDLNIGASAFYGCTNAREIVIKGNSKNTLDAGKTTIGTSAFSGMSELRTLTVEAGAYVTEIGNNAFAANKKLRNINIADTAKVEKIGDSAFRGCETLPSFTIPASTVSIGNYAFADCSFISKIVFAPNGQNIDFGIYVFQNCVSLSRVELPATVQSFDGSAFDGCYSLKEVVVDSNNAFLTTKNGVLYDKNYTTIMFYPKAINDPTLSQLPWDTLTTIGNTVFKDNTNITSITIPATVTSIGDSAFNGCINLTSVTFTGTAASMSIGEYAFANCQKLTSIQLPSAVTEIKEGTFYVTPLTSFTIPENVTAIGKKAFMYTGIKAINIPAKVAVIGDGAFAYSSLETITIEDGNTALVIGDVTDIDISYDFETGDYNKMKVAKVFPIEYIGVGAYGVFTGTHLQALHLPARVTTIGAFAFYNQKAIAEVTIAENSNLTTIGDGAFYGADITSIQLENTKLATVGEFAFTESKLTGVKFPNTLTLLDKYSFADIGTISGSSFTGSLASVEFANGGTVELTIATQVFRNSVFTTITFPANLTNCYEEIMVSSTSAQYAIFMPSFYRIFEGNYKLAAINVAEGGKYFASHEGVFYEKKDGALTHLLMCPPAKTGEYVVPKTVTQVAQRAFYMTQLTKVSFEEYDKTDANYGTALLEIGSGETTNSNATGWAVFGGAKLYNGVQVTSTLLSSYRSDVVKMAVRNTHYIQYSALQNLSFPSHLKSMGTAAITGIYTQGFEVVFNQDTQQVHFGVQAIRSNEGLVKLILPKVAALSTSTSGYTFGTNKNLVEVTFAEGSTLPILAPSTFSGNSSMTTIKIPASVEIIGESCFYNCSKLTSITYEEGSKLASIENTAFRNTGFTEFVIPDSVTYLGRQIFDGCTALKKVTVGLGVGSPIYVDTNGNKSSAFYGCKSIEEYIVPNNHPTLSVVDGVLYDLNKTIVYAYPTAKDPTDFVLPTTVREIEAYAFAYSTLTTITLHEGMTKLHYGAFYMGNIQSVHIPSTMVEIGTAAFYFNSSNGKAPLKSITFAENSRLTTLGSSVFYYSNLTEISLPDSITTMGTGVFYYNQKLKSVVLPAALTVLPSSTFNNCKALESVVIQNNVERIEGSVFGGSLTKLKSIHIPASVTRIGHQVFYQCKGLEEVTFGEGSRLNFMDYQCFYGCEALKEIVFPEGVETIGRNQFSGCKNLEFVDLSKTAITILQSNTYTTTVDGVSKVVYQGFFTGCTKLKTVLLPETLETIDPNTFSGNYGKPNDDCVSLESIYIPASVTKIGDSAFEDCSSLTSVTFAQDSVLTALGSDPLQESAIFRGTTSLKTIDLPESIETIGGNIFENSGLTEITLPQSLSAISAGAFKGCEGLVDVVVPGSVADIYNEAFMNCVNIETLTLSEGVEYLGANAFGGCSKLAEVVIPSTTMRMGGNPFANCLGITSFKLADGNEGFVIDQTGVLYDANKRSVIFYPSYATSETYEMPSTVFELATSAFAGSKLKSIVISDNIKVIPDNCFKGSVDLESVKIPLSVTTIGNEAFRDCVKLDNVAIPASCTSIGDYAFQNCASLKNFDFGTRNTSLDVGLALFQNCTSLEEIILPEGLTAIPEYMFANTGIKDVVVPETVTDLSGRGLFKGCAELVSIVLPTTYVGDLGAEAFRDCVKLKSIVIPNGVRYFNTCDDNLDEFGDEIWESATFKNCYALESVTFGTGLCDPGPRAFENCISLKEADMGDTGIWCLGDYVFRNCVSLEKVVLSYDSYDLGYNTFEGCTKIGGSIDIPYFWFYGGFFIGCTGIEEVHIFDGDAFENYGYGDDPVGNFEGWTSEQSIYFDELDWETMFYDYWWGFLDEDPWIFPFLNCEARVFDCEGNEILYDGEECIILQVVSPDGEILWDYNEQ